jgi:TatD DNase family protein
MLGLFDTHAHFEGTEQETLSLIERAHRSGVKRILAVGGSESLDSGALRAKALSKDVIIDVALGRDRDQYSKPCPKPDPSAVAIGEIGLDYHYDLEHRDEQCELFAKQLEYAREIDKPVIIHTREADDDTLGILREIPSRGVIHSFTGSPKFCRSLLDLGFMISFSGIVTFRAADNVRQSQAVVPDESILIETDTPFLAPVPMRGNPNEPAFIVHTAKFLADLRNMRYEDFADLTYINAHKTFDLKECE